MRLNFHKSDCGMPIGRIILASICLLFFQVGTPQANASSGVVGHELNSKQTPSSTYTIKVTGTVKDDQGGALPGVSIRVEGQRLGMTTDNRGLFEVTFRSKSPQGTLIFSFIGMQTEKVKVKNGDHINVILKDDVQTINEVVVTGYQNLDKREMVGAYTTIKPDEIMMPAFSSIDQMLQGQVPGMVVSYSSAKVGAKPQIKVRGTATLLGSTDPLWVVDGVIQPEPMRINTNDAMTMDFETLVGNQISWLNPNDIESITVLKDASATAIYGSRASNGVIVITTKKAKQEHLSINYRTSLSMRSRPRYSQFNLMNSEERVLYSKRAFDLGAHYDEEPVRDDKTFESLWYSYLNRHIDKPYFDQRVDQLRRANTDWFDLLTRNSFSMQHYLSASGATQKASYNASLSYSSNKGVEKRDQSEHFGARTRLGIKLSPTVRVDFGLVAQKGKSSGYGAGVSPISYATSTSRAIEPYTPEGDLSFYKRKSSYQYISPRPLLGYNILNEIAHSGSASQSSDLMANLNFSWNITPHLKYEIAGGIGVRTNLAESYAGEQTYYIADKYRGFDYGTAEPGTDIYKAAVLPFGGRYFTSEYSINNYNVHNTLTFYKIFNQKHKVNVLVGNEVNSSTSRNISNTVWGFVKERGEQIMLPTYLEDFVPIGGYGLEGFGVFDELYNGAWRKYSQTDNFISFFGTAAYTYADRYVLNFNIRSDASNRFGQDTNKQFDPTYSLGFSWRAGEEKFVKEKLSFIKDFTIRLSYGIQGNALTNLSPDLIAYVGRVEPGYNQYSSKIRSLPNPNLSWERTHSWNAGWDMNLFNRLNVGLEYYGRKSNAVVEQPIPQEYGRPSMFINGGIILNQGIELSIMSTLVKSKDWTWTLGFHTAKNINKLESDPKKLLNLSQFLSGRRDMILKKGFPIAAFWSFDYDHLDPATGYPVFNLLDTEYNTTTDDPTKFLVYSGTREPLFSGGLNTRIKYKNLSLSAHFSLFVGGKRRLPALFGNNGYMPSPYSNVYKDMFDSWSQPGDEQHTDIPALFHSGIRTIKLPNNTVRSMYNLWDQSDLRVVDASFLRCNQISLMYIVPRKYLESIGLKSLQLSGNVNNPFVIASKKFRGFDPELGYSVMPSIYTMSINVGF